MMTIDIQRVISLGHYSILFNPSSANVGTPEPHLSVVPSGDFQEKLDQEVLTQSIAKQRLFI